MNLVEHLVDYNAQWRIKNKNKFFLDGKSKFYHDALEAELNALERASPILKIEDILQLKRIMLFEDCHKQTRNKTPETNAYQNFITKKIQNRILLETKQNYR